MITESTREKIKREYSEFFPRDNMDELIDLYDKAIDYPTDEQGVAGVSRALNTCVNKVLGKDARNMSDEEWETFAESFLKVEPFFKKVLLIKDKATFDTVMSSGKSTLGYVYNTLGVLDAIKESNGHIPFESDPQSHRDKGPYIEHYLKAYSLRNVTSHEAREWTELKMLLNIQSVIIASLHVCKSIRTQIVEKCDEKEKEIKIDIADNINEIIKDYEATINDGFCFVPVKWSAAGHGASKSLADKNISMNTLRDDIGKIKQLMLKGEAGCGKSTSIDYLEYHDAVAYKADHTRPIPVKLVLKHVSDKNFSIEDYICRFLKVSPEYCRKLLNKGAINLYLDGVNEVLASAEVKRIVVTEIERFIEKYKNTFVLITDREQVEVKIDKDLPTLILRQMDEYDIKNYISQTVKNKEYVDTIAEYTSQMIDAGVVFTPILINFVMDYYEKENSFPENSTILIWEYIKSLLKRENEDKKDPSATEKRLGSLLLYLAVQDIPEEGFSDVQILNYFRICKEKLGITDLDTAHCLDLSLQLGILEELGNNYIFANEEYANTLAAIGFEKGIFEIDG